MNREQREQNRFTDYCRPHVLLMIETAMAFGRGVLEGVSRYLIENPPWSVQLDLRELQIASPTWLRDWEGDGIITRFTTPELAEVIQHRGIPTVNLTDIYGDQGLPSIWSDHEAIGRMAAEHLMQRGLQHFAFSGFSDHHWSYERYRGFQRALQSRGYDCFFHNSGWSSSRVQGWESQQRDIVDWLMSLPQPIGIMACNDFRGQHLLEGCRSASISVPERAAVVGVDNDQVICDFCQPPLTSVIPAAERIGFEAATMLDQLMRGERIDTKLRLVQPLGMAERQSTSVMSIDDPEVVAALRIIRDHAFTGVTVNDILRQVPIARSSLERRFRRAVGRSPKAQIRITQLRRAQQLLRETDLPLTQIAGLVGFKHAEYFSVVFKREVGQTPGAYREQASGGRNAHAEFHGLG